MTATIATIATETETFPTSAYVVPLFSCDGFKWTDTRETFVVLAANADAAFHAAQVQFDASNDTRTNVALGEPRELLF